MLPLIERICVKKKKWITDTEMTDLPAVAESSPGPIAINCATYIGYKQKGIPGALAATFGVIVPSFVIILVISFFIDGFLENKWVAGAFYGIKIAVGILIIDAAIKLFSKLPKNALTISIGTVSFLLMTAVNVFALKISSVALMLLAAAVGLAIWLARRKRAGGEAE